MLQVALLLALATWPQSTAPRGCRDRSCERGRVINVASTAAATCAPDISCAVTAGDEAGNWWALKGDGTMLASSAITLVNQASSGVSPLTFNGTTQYFKTAGTQSFPAGDFSFVASFNINAADGGGVLMAQWGPIIVRWIVYTKADHSLEFGVLGAGLGIYDLATPQSTGTFLAVAGSYNGTTGAMVFRSATTYGSGSGTGGGGVLGLATNTSTGGNTDGSALMFKGTSRGMFFTEKILSTADMDRIMAGAL